MMEEGGDEQAFLEAGKTQARDHARAPVQWAPLPHGGFTTGDPWIRSNSNCRKINVSQQEADESSILNYYKAIIQMRKQHPALIYGAFTPIENPNDEVYIYDRKLNDAKIRVVLNFSSTSHKVSGITLSGDLLISNYSFERKEEILRPWEARVIRLS